MFHKERDMTEHVVRWLIEAGFTVRTETMVGYGYCDVTAYDSDSRRLIAIELKLTKITEAMRQASTNQSFAESYVAFPSTVAHKIIDKPRWEAYLRQGIGIISVTQCEVSILVDAIPCPHSGPDTLHDHIVRRFQRHGSRISTRTIKRRVKGW